MSKTTLFSAAGIKKEAKLNLPKEVFGLEVNPALLKSAYLASQAEERTAGAKTLRRGEVRGGGRKPWRQKGTGRARVGSRRSPLWRGGGVVFGPTGGENYTVNLTTKMKRLAIAQALSAKAAADCLVIIENFDPKGGKTKEADRLLEKLGAAGRVLIATDKKSETAEHAVRNLPGVRLVNATYLSARSVIDADQIILTKPALEMIASWLGADRGKHQPQSEVASKVTAKTRPKTEAKR